MKTSFLQEGLVMLILTLLATVAASFYPGLLAHPTTIPLTLLAAAMIAFVPWLDLCDDLRQRAEIRNIEARFPGMRASTVRGTDQVLLTNRATGRTFREIRRGVDF